MTAAYLRVSTEHQMVENQRNEIEKYVASRGLEVDKWVMETASGKKKGRERKLSRLVKQLKKGDILIVTELSRLSRTLLDIMSIVSDFLRKEVSIHCTKENHVVDDSLNSKVLLFAFGLVAELERNLISMRTKEALELRRKMGVTLGRPHGTTPKLNILINNKIEIEAMLADEASIASICKRYGVSRGTFKKYQQLERESVD